jgi:hypothetical protein
MEQEEKKISKFSSGINILQRVDQLWKNCHSFKRSGHYYRWNEELDSVWLELARDLEEKEYYDLDEDGEPIKNKLSKKKVQIKGYKSHFDKFEEQLKELLPFTDAGNSGFQEPTKDQIEKRNKQYSILMEKQLFLARLENELGKGTSWDEEDDDF